MRQMILRLSLVLAVVLVGLAGTAVLAQEEEPQAPVLGAVNITQPELFMTEAGASEELPIRSPTVFDPGETLRSDATGVALITWFYDGTESVLGPESKLMLKDFSGEAKSDFVIDLELTVGQLVSGMGAVADMSENGSWTLATPSLTVKLLRGQFEVTVADDKATLLVVTEGRVEVTPTGAEAITIDANQYITVGANGAVSPVGTLSDDGVTVNLTGVCTATANTNLNVRLAPNEDSRRLSWVPGGQVLWVRSATEGDLWLQVYVQTDPVDEEAHNFGWVYGPAVTMDETTPECASLIHAPLDAHLYGGLGVDHAVGAEGESEPVGS